MSVSPWFDYNAYMTNKLAQLKAAAPDANWTMDNVAAAFAANGYIGIEGAERHFMDFGQNEDVAPNAFFNPTEYYRAKAAHAYGKDVKAVTDADAALVKAAIKGLGMNAWSHYDTFGSSEKVNPSNQFDTEKYMIAKKDALNSIEGGKQYTIDEVYAAFKAAGISALEHFMTFGGNGNKGEVTQKYEGSIPDAFSVPEEKKVNAGGGSEGTNFVLTTGVDTFTGTANDDSFVAGIVNGMDTLNGGDKLDGGAGRDTLSIYGTQSLAGVTAKSIERFEFNGYTGTGAYVVDAGQFAGLDTVTIQNITGSTNPTFKVDNMVDGGTIGIGGSITGYATRGNGSSDNVSAIQGQFVDGAAIAKLAVDNLSTKVLVQLGGKGLNTVNISGTTTKTGVVYLDDGLTSGTGSPATADDTITTVNIDSKGGLFSLTGSKIKTVDAHASTGDLTLEFTKGAVAADLAVTTGSGNDKVMMDLENLSAKDVIDLGAGDKDVLNLKVSAATTSTNDTVATGTFEGIAGGTASHTFTADAYALINKVAGAEILEVGNNTGGVAYASLDASKLANINTIHASINAEISGLDSADLVQAKGGAVLKLTGKVLAGDSAPQTFRVEALSSADLTDKLLISADSSTKMELSGAGNIDVHTTGAVAYTIDGGKMQGFLTAGGSSAVDKIITGSGGSDITASQGKDAITFGAGKDVYNFVTAAQNSAALTNMDTLSGFQTGQDKIVFKSITTPTEQTSITKVEKAFTTDLATTLGTGVVSKAGVTVVTITGDSSDAGVYAIYSADTSYAASDDYVVKLAGVTADQLAAGDFAVGA